MAQLTYFQAIDMTNVPSWTGDIVVAGPGYFGVQGENNAAVFLGNFSYSENIISGFVTGYDLFRGSALEVQVRDVVFDATAVQSAVNQGDFEIIQEAALRGSTVVRGSFQSDVLIGSDGDDLLIGMQGDDLLIGGEGSDTLVGGPGNDTLVGGSGLDFAVFAGTIGEYQADFTDDGFLRITDSIALARDGVNILQGIERLRFHDGDLALDVDGIAGQAYRIYKAAFDRQPDPEGLGFWIGQMDNGLALSEVAQGFLGSAEFQRLYGTNPTNEQFVNALYQNILQRPGEQEGVDFWVGLLQAGASRADVLVELSESPENQAIVAPLIADGIFYTPFLV